jgi:predicted peroxiredoxin
MTDNVLVTLSCGTDNPNRTTRAVFFAMMAHKEGKNVNLFLLDEGVYIAKKGMAEHIKAATGDACDDHMTYLQAQGVPILVCTPCAASRQITEEDLIDGARMATGVEMIHLACDAAVISL